MSLKFKRKDMTDLRDILTQNLKQARRKSAKQPMTPKTAVLAAKYSKKVTPEMLELIASDTETAYEHSFFTGE